MGKKTQQNFLNNRLPIQNQDEDQNTKDSPRPSMNLSSPSLYFFLQLQLSSRYAHYMSEWVCSNETPSSHINTSCGVALGLWLFTLWIQILLEVAKSNLQLLGDEFTNTTL